MILKDWLNKHTRKCKIFLSDEEHIRGDIPKSWLDKKIEEVEDRGDGYYLWLEK